jgi:hypothetical protein
MRTSELIKELQNMIERHGDKDVAIRTEEGTFDTDGCYYDSFVDSIVISED